MFVLILFTLNQNLTSLLITIDLTEYALTH